MQRYIALRCPEMDCIALHCPTLNITALHCAMQHYIAMHCNALHCNPSVFHCDMFCPSGPVSVQQEGTCVGRDCRGETCVEEELTLEFEVLSMKGGGKGILSKLSACGFKINKRSLENFVQ